MLAGGWQYLPVCGVSWHRMSDRSSCESFISGNSHHGELYYSSVLKLKSVIFQQGFIVCLVLVISIFSSWGVR